MARTAEARDFDYYPAFLDLYRKRVVVIGGGELATGKVSGLLPCGPDPLVVIAPWASDFVQEHEQAGHLAWYRREYRDGDLADAELCFAATNDRDVNAVVAIEARRRGTLVLAIDDIPNCDFIAPAIVRRGRMVVAISTQGRSPAMASHTRRTLERDLPDEWGALLDVAATVRDRLGPARSRIAPEAWQVALDDDLKELVWQHRLEDAAELLHRRLIAEVVS